MNYLGQLYYRATIYTDSPGPQTELCKLSISQAKLTSSCIQVLSWQYAEEGIEKGENGKNATFYPTPLSL